jgi:hypothetical protein
MSKKAAEKQPEAKANKTAKPAPADSDGQTEKKAPSDRLGPNRVAVLQALKSGKALTKKELIEATKMDATAFGFTVAYTGPKGVEINARPVHANSLINRKFVEIAHEEGKAATFTITKAGKEALAAAK